MLESLHARQMGKRDRTDNDAQAPGEKIDVTRYLDTMERDLHAGTDGGTRNAALAILRRWQFDTMLTSYSREWAARLVKEFTEVGPIQKGGAMKKPRGAQPSTAVDEQASSRVGMLIGRIQTSQAGAPMPLGASAAQRKASVLHAMPTIRRLLSMHRFQVDAYSDEAIADALLETCPQADDFWLRAEHLALAVHRVTTADKRKPVS